MTISKYAAVATLALLTSACAGSFCRTVGPCANKMTNASVLFAFNSAELTVAGKKALNTYVSPLKDETKTAQILGYTDDMGDESYNLGLSQRRANAAKSYLVSQGVAANRLTAKGMGETNFVAANDTIANRSKNRRIEIIIK